MLRLIYIIYDFQKYSRNLENISYFPNKKVGMVEINIHLELAGYLDCKIGLRPESEQVRKHTPLP